MARFVETLTAVEARMLRALHLLLVAAFRQLPACGVQLNAHASVSLRIKVQRIVLPWNVIVSPCDASDVNAEAPVVYDVSAWIVGAAIVSWVAFKVDGSWTLTSGVDVIKVTWTLHSTVINCDSYATFMINQTFMCMYQTVILNYPTVMYLLEWYLLSCGVPAREVITVLWCTCHISYFMASQS